MLERAKSQIFKYRAYLLGIFCLGLIWDIFFSPQISDLVVLILGILWVLSIFSFKFWSQVSLVLATLSYVVSFVFQFFSQEMIMEKGASWFFVFLLIGLTQALIINFSGNGKET